MIGSRNSEMQRAMKELWHVSELMDHQWHVYSVAYRSVHKKLMLSRFFAAKTECDGTRKSLKNHTCVMKLGCYVHSKKRPLLEKWELLREDIPEEYMHSDSVDFGAYDVRKQPLLMRIDPESLKVISESPIELDQLMPLSMYGVIDMGSLTPLFEEILNCGYDEWQRAQWEALIESLN